MEVGVLREAAVERWQLWVRRDLELVHHVLLDEGEGEGEGEGGVRVKVSRQLVSGRGRAHEWERRSSSVGEEELISGRGGAHQWEWRS